MNIASFAIISLRLLAVAVFFLATWKMLGGIISSLGDINPAYFGYFFQKVILGPFLGVLLSILLFGASKPLGRWLSRNLDS